jgi:hypothetical protein
MDVKKWVFLFCLGVLIAPETPAFETVDYIGDINFPKSHRYVNIAVDNVGRIYLGQKGENQIAVFNKFGSHIDSVRLEGKHYFSRGGNFSVDKGGRIFLVDAADDILRIFGVDGKTVFTIGGRAGDSAGSFRAPRGIDIDREGNLYVADTGNRRIQIFNPDGIYVGGIVSGDKLGAKSSQIRLVRHEMFSGRPIPKQPLLKGPTDVGVDRDGYIYVLDERTRFIVIYSKRGAYMGNIDLNRVRGRRDLEPIALCIGQDRVFVLDDKYHNIKVFDRRGKFRQEIGTKGTGRGQFYKPRDLTIVENRLYILDSGNNRIQIFRYGERAAADYQDFEMEDRPKMAIFSFTDTNRHSRDKMLGSTVSEMLTTAFVSSGKFEILERKEIARVVDELNFDMSGMVSKDSAKEIGKLLGVDLGLMGSVSVLSGRINVDVRLLDMKTGIILIASDKSIQNEILLRDTIADMVLEIERAYLNRLGAPSPPRGLFAMPSIRSIFLKWDPNPEEDVTGYNLFRSPADGGGSFEKIAHLKSTEYTVNDLPENSDWFFRITAVDSEGKESEPSELLKAHTRRPPDFGYVLKIRSKAEAKEIKFSWNDPQNEDVIEYQIYRSRTLDGEYGLVGTSNNRSFKDGGLEDGTTYHYKIRKVYPKGLLSRFSNSFSIATDAKPRMIAVFEAESNLPRRVELKWKPAPEDNDIVKYVLYRSETPGENYQVIKKIHHFFKHYTDKDLKDNTTYYYRVQAIDKYGLKSDPSREIFATTKDIPATPQNVVAESNLARRIRLSWDFPEPGRNDIEFLVYRSESINGEFSKIGDSDGTEYLDDRLPDNAQYFYFVTANDKDDLVSNPSEIVTATTKPLPVPPANLNAVDRQPRKVTVLWDPNPEPDIALYRVYRSERMQGRYRDIAETPETVFIDDDKGRGLDDNTTYFYRVTAVDVEGLESEFPETVQATTKALPPAPRDIVVEYEDDALVLSWPPVPGDDIFGYVIYKNRKKIEIVKTNLFIDRNVEPGKSYYYEVSALDNDQLEGPQSEKTRFKMKD